MTRNINTGAIIISQVDIDISDLTGYDIACYN